MTLLNRLMVMGIGLMAIGCSCSSNNADEPNPDPAPVLPEVGEGNQMVVYEANPLFFAEKDCFSAIGNRLDAIASMDVNVLWLMPIYELGQEKAIGSPYCVKDYKGINPKYGDMAALKKLVNDAHGKGMIVILDWVANHTAWDNAWVKEHPDWFTDQRNPTEQPWQDVAILNYDNKAVWTAMTDAMTYWVKEAGIDGFRCDYAEGVPGDFWKQAIEAIRAVKSDAFMLAEGSVMDLYSYGFDMIYDWSYCTDLQDFYKGKIDFAKLLANTQAKEEKIPEGKTIMRYVVNHDVISEHSPVELYGSNDAIPGAYVITAFMSEVPLIYSGMEAGFDGRTAFIGAKPLTWNAALLSEYDKIMSAYKATAKARGGKLVNYSNGAAAIFAHANGASEVLVMVNPTKAELTVKTPMAYQGKKMRNAITGQETTLTAGVTLPAYGYCIFSK